MNIIMFQNPVMDATHLIKDELDVIKRMTGISID